MIEAGGLEGRGMENSCLMGRHSDFAKWKSSVYGWWWQLHQITTVGQFTLNNMFEDKD